MEAFEAYFRRADLDQDGRISSEEAVAFLQLSNLPKHILAQIWMHADQNRTGYLGRPEFYNVLRLVTVAQSGRELTPDMIKAALYGPAAAKIPAPKMNLVSTSVAQMNSATIPTPHSNNMVSSSQMGVMGPAAQNFGFRGQQALPNVAANNFMRPPAASLPIQGGSQGLLGGGSVAGPRLPSSNSLNLSTDWLGARTSVASVGLTPQAPIRGLTPSVNHDGFGLSQLGTAPGVTHNSQKPSVSASSIPPRQPSLQPAANVSKSLVFSGNGFSSDSIDGGDLFSATPQAKQDVSKSISNASNMPNSFSIPLVTAGSQSFVKPGQPDPLQSTPTLPPIGNQLQQAQSLVKQNQLYTTQTTSASTASNVSVGSVSSGSSQSQLPWPRISQSDIQKYTSVFVEVDKDRDGKITGEEARNLFLSWKLPREVLKQVWDLSDQDSDSMLSLREFCTALYLMERHREGRPLPAVLPNSLRFDETLLLATGQPSTAHVGPAWQPHPGLSQQGRPEPRPVMTATGVKPPMPTFLASQTDGTVQPLEQKSKVPVLEQHLVYQLSKEEQSSLNSKFQEAADADKKVQELEKAILDSREKIEFYRTKMQELVLYKSKCDNRLNEVMERASANKHEVESLAKKYESKYKQTGDVASKLTAEEATFREIQENKLTLFNAIVKMEQAGNVDGSLQVRADQIQSDLNDLIKALNERCKQYGLRAKPTSLIELPFGWQPGIQDGAAGWDEDWDTFEEEGFTVIKELTTEVENVVATAKLKPPSVESDKASKDEVSPMATSSDVDNKIEKLSKTGERIESESADAHSEDGSARSLPGSPGRSGLESSSQEFHSTQLGIHDISPHAKESHIDHGGAESTISGDKSADEPSWGATFDASDDADSVWGFNSLNVKETDRDSGDRNFFFGSGGFGLNPIRTDSPSAASSSGRRAPFFDSVPSTPQFNSGSSPRFNEGPEDRSFDNFGRFDSFNMHDGGLFPQRETLARFDSMGSEKLARFDSIRSTTDHNRGFPSFDDADPFGSSGPFKSSESHTPKRGTDHWSAF